MFQVKLQLLLSYCTNVAFYLLLKAEVICVVDVSVEFGCKIYEKFASSATRCRRGEHASAVIVFYIVIATEK